MTGWIKTGVATAGAPQVRPAEDQIESWRELNAAV